MTNIPKTERRRPIVLPGEAKGSAGSAGELPAKLAFLEHIDAVKPVMIGGHVDLKKGETAVLFVERGVSAPDVVGAELVEAPLEFLADLGYSGVKLPGVTYFVVKPDAEQRFVSLRWPSEYAGTLQFTERE